MANAMRYRIAVLSSPFLIACHSVAPSQSSAERYLATAIPIDVGEGIKLCVAVDPDDQSGVWEWMPGETGCASRSSGPALFQPEGAIVSRRPPGTISISFRIGTHSSARPFIDVRLVAEHDTMRSLETQHAVPVLRRRNLDVPEVPTRGRDVP